MMVVMFMGFEIKVSYKNLDEAVTNLNSLQERLEAYIRQIPPKVENSKGEIIDKLLLSYNEIKNMGKALSKLIIRTQKSVSNVSTSFKNAENATKDFFENN